MTNLTSKIDNLNERKVLSPVNISTADLAEAMYKEWKHKYQKINRGNRK